MVSRGGGQAGAREDCVLLEPARLLGVEGSLMERVWMAGRRRPAGDYCWDIYVNGVMVEGGFWSREAAAAAYLRWLDLAGEKK